MSDRPASVALATFGALALLLGAVGTVAVVAEFRGAWTSYFLMERVVAASAPLAAALSGLALVAGFVVVYRAG